MCKVILILSTIFKKYIEITKESNEFEILQNFLDRKIIRLKHI